MNLFEQQASEFWERHIGPSEQETGEMLQTIGVASLDELVDKTVPQVIRMDKPLNVAGPVSEHEYLNELRKTATKNLGAVMFSFLFLLLKTIAIASAAAVPSSSKDAFAIGSAVKSLTIV